MYTVIFVGAMLLIAAVADIRTGRIPLCLIVIGIAGVVSIRLVSGEAGAAELFFGAVTGAVLMLMSVVSRGKVGMGDGLLFVMTGMAVGAVANLVLMWAVFMVAGLFGTIRSLLGHGSMRDELPLVPFIFAGWITEALSKVFA